ncbi:MAG TPA: hypothetical protein VM260_16480 [Pirellula sp.]|nr:hypothetical protein [Pirellula sp.]
MVKIPRDKLGGITLVMLWSICRPAGVSKANGNDCIRKSCILALSEPGIPPAVVLGKMSIEPQELTELCRMKSPSTSGSKSSRLVEGWNVPLMANNEVEILKDYES